MRVEVSRMQLLHVQHIAQLTLPTQLLRRQYLDFCTSKASKLSVYIVGLVVSHIYIYIYIYITYIMYIYII